MLDLDTRDLLIESVTSLEGKRLRSELAKAEPILGSRLRIDLPPGTRGVRIRSVTSPKGRGRISVVLSSRHPAPHAPKPSKVFRGPLDGAAAHLSEGGVRSD